MDFIFEYDNDAGNTDMERKPLVDGPATFTIIDARAVDDGGVRLVTKGGVPKMVVTFDVVDSNGTKGRVFEHISAKASWKLKALLGSLGCLELYTTACSFHPPLILGGEGEFTLKTDGAYYVNVDKYKPFIPLHPQAILEDVPF